MTQRVLGMVVVLAAAMGFAFAAVSTSDFVKHLDRQVHGIHCSFLPGVDAPDLSGSSGCAVTLMSSYSSIMRDAVWGGIPISLPAMAVFAYLAFYAAALLVTKRTNDRRATSFLAAATLLPLVTSVVMGFIALHELDAACKLCIGIYVSSALAFAAATALALRSGREVATNKDLAERTVPDAYAPTLEARPEQARRLATASEMDRRLGVRRTREDRTGDAAAPVSFGSLGAAFAIGVAFVVFPVLVYAANSPNFEGYLGACGALPSPSDRDRVLVPLGPQTEPTQVIEVLDPLCPACRGFERRFAGLDAATRVSRKVLLFPLDNNCNWMVDRAIHPGACAVSEAVLCAEEDADEVIEWAFAHQEEIRAATERNPNAAERMVRERFASLGSCIGGARVRARLNLALRWAVANQLPVLTPQVYVDGTRICDADTDLGLDWTLGRLLERAEGSAR